MALSDAEVQRLKFELGYPVLSISAEPRIDHVAIFDQVIQPYLEAGASTTSSTSVTAASSPTAVTLTLADATDFAAGDVVLVDVDSKQERATVRSVSGSTIVVLLSLAHSGTYPVVVEGAESIVRDLLSQLRDIGDKIAETQTSSGLKSVGRGAVEWFGESSALTSLKKLQMEQRDELSSIVGVPNLWRFRSGGGSRVELY